MNVNARKTYLDNAIGTIMREGGIDNNAAIEEMIAVLVERLDISTTQNRDKRTVDGKRVSALIDDAYAAAKQLRLAAIRLGE